MLAGISWTLARASLISSSVPNQTSCVWLPDRDGIFSNWMTYHTSQCPKREAPSRRDLS